jgi:hypothetical protein
MAGFQLYEDGKLLGRDGKSWFRILGFYACYYSFLGFLIYFAVGKYAERMPLPGGTRGQINTRVDMPGAGVYPFSLIDSSIDRDGELHLSSNNMGDDQNKAYLKHMQQFIDGYASGEECLGAKNAKDVTCNVGNLKQLNDLEKALENKQPIVAVSINKIYGWTPINNNGLPNQPFIKNSIQMTCGEAKSDGSPMEKSEFDVELLGEKSIRPTFFPYLAKDKFAENSEDFLQYNKPFLVAQIKPKNENAWKLDTANKQKLKYFRCELFADNLERPKTGQNFYNANDDVKSWSNDLNKLGIGFVQFAFTFDA